MKELIKKALKKVSQESDLSAEEIQKLLRNTSEQSAGSPVGQGKNLEALMKARQNAIDLEDLQKSSYPKNIVQDDLATPPSGMTKDFTMVPEGSQVPAIIPEVMEAAPKSSVPALVSRGENVSDSAYKLPTVLTTSKNISEEAKKRMNPRLAALLGGAGLGAIGLSMIGEDEAPVQPPMAKTMKTPQPEEEFPYDLMDAGAQDEALSMSQSTEPKKVSAAPKAEPVKTAAPVMDELSLLQSAQDRDAQDRFMAGLLRAGTTIGGSLAMTKPDYSGVDAIEKNVGVNEKNVKSQIASKADAEKIKTLEQENNDMKQVRNPNSKISQFYREQFGRFLPGIGPNTSAFDMQKAIPQLTQLVSTQMATERAKELAQINANKKEGKVGSDFVKGAQKSLMKPYQEFQKVDSAYQSLQNFANDTKLQAGPKDVAMLYDFIKTLDPGSVVREGEIALTKQGMSQLESLGLRINRITKSDILTPQFRDGIAQIAKTKRDTAFENYDQIRQPYLQEAKALGLSEEDFDRFDYGAGTQKEKVQQKPSVKLGSQKKPGSIITTKSGKTYRVNADGLTATEQ